MISVNQHCHHKSNVIPPNRLLLKFFQEINETKRELLLLFVILLILLKRSHLCENSVAEMKGILMQSS
jgi:hypothetical protein